MKKTLTWFANSLAAITITTLSARAATYSQVAGADTFVSSGQPNLNFGSQGAMQIAGPTATQPRTLLTLLRFETAGLQASFDADFGSGNWMVTSVTLSLFSNVNAAGAQPGNPNYNRIAAGNFAFDLLGNNNWDENTITWNTINTILPGAGNANTQAPLGTFFWATEQAAATWTLGNDPALLQDIYTGNAVTILGRPTDGSGVGYLFNTTTMLNPGLLNIAAEAVPEPSPLALLGVSLCVVGMAGARTSRPRIGKN